jgi:hypothetical protein
VDLEVGVDKTYSIRPLRDGSEYERMQKPNETLVAATFSKAKTYVFARLKIRDREVGGSNPLAPTIYFQSTYGRQHWRLVFLVVADLWQALLDEGFTT